ncbi:hypothetical protein LGR54_19615 [Ancylobacter sp. Lp-2]|uniref:hypothetical protein n=1 Tax=Ancylobacter sp. Lp-2 TaxID=2881339 RepID=UPI001E5F0666|nr:hypothetical protein [Ancylobacter sp. Lp-2]MCB4770825.1 hypothetical protein [Ancylobacter sp. Lp-2]
MIEAEVATFIEGAVMTILASRDAAMVAAIGRGVGTRRIDAATFETLVSRAQWPHLLANLQPAAPLAVTFVRAEDYRCYQIKAEVTGLAEAGEEDRARALSYIAAMSARLGALEVPPRPITAWLTDRDLLRIAYRPLALYAQTPGPQAGQRLAGRTQGGGVA